MIVYMRFGLVLLLCALCLHVFAQEGNGCDVISDSACIYYKNGKKKRCVINYMSPVNHWHRIEYFDEKERLIKEVEAGMYPEEYDLEYFDTALKQSYFYNDSDLLIKFYYFGSTDTFETQYFYTESKKKYKEISFNNGRKLSVIYFMYDLEGNFRVRVSDDLKGSKYIEYFNPKQQPDSTISYENDKLKQKTIFNYNGNKTSQITTNSKNEILEWTETEMLKDSYIRISKNALGRMLSKNITYNDNIEISYNYIYDEKGKLLGWQEYKGFCNGLRKIYDVRKNAKGKIIEKLD